MPYGQQYNSLEQLNSVISETVSRISDFTRSPGDFTRNRKLNASTTIKITLNMEGQSLNTEMIHAFPDMNDRMTSSAYIQQKRKLSPDVFLHIFREYNQTPHKNNLYNGKYQIYAIDGSDFNIPYQSKSKYALDCEKGRLRKDGLPVKPSSILHGNILYNISDRTYEDIVIQPKSQMDERKAAVEMLNRLRPVVPYIVVMDRGYEGFNMIEHGNRLNGEGFYVIRTRVAVGGIKEIANLPDRECDVDMSFRVTTSNRYYMLNKDKESIHLKNSPKNTHKKNLSPNTRYSSWDFKQFETVKCRVVKFRINEPDTGKQEWEVLLTNLNRVEFPVSEMKKLYHMRWDIETSFRELKYALGAVQFHSRKDSFVEMELLAHLIMFNVVSRTINEVQVPQSETRKYEYVVSFKDAVTLIRKHYRLYNGSLYDTIYAELLRYTRPLVSGKAESRSMKPKTAIWFVYRVA